MEFTGVKYVITWMNNSKKGTFTWMTPVWGACWWSIKSGVPRSRGNWRLACTSRQ